MQLILAHNLAKNNIYRSKNGLQQSQDLAAVIRGLEVYHRKLYYIQDQAMLL